MTAPSRPRVSSTPSSSSPWAPNSVTHSRRWRQERWLSSPSPYQGPRRIGYTPLLQDLVAGRGDEAVARVGSFGVAGAEVVLGRVEVTGHAQVVAGGLEARGQLAPALDGLVQKNLRRLAESHSVFILLVELAEIRVDVVRAQFEHGLLHGASHLGTTDQHYGVLIIDDFGLDRPGEEARRHVGAYPSTAKAGDRSRDVVTVRGYIRFLALRLAEQDEPGSSEPLSNIEAPDEVGSAIC